MVDGLQRRLHQLHSPLMGMLLPSTGGGGSPPLEPGLACGLLWTRESTEVISTVLLLGLTLERLAASAFVLSGATSHHAGIKLMLSHQRIRPHVEGTR